MAILGTGREADTIFFNWPEIATALLKLRSIHTGWWRAGLQFDLHAANLHVPTGKTTSTLVPGAMVSALNVNIREVPEEKVDELCVNAAVVNPRPHAILNPFGARVN